MLNNRHAFITGAGAGIGADIALQLAQAGCRLTLCGRSQDKLQAQAEALRAQVPDVAVLIAPMDVADEHAVQAAVQQAQASFGPVNILVNNAGQAHSAPFAKTDAALWQQMLNVNLTGTYHCIQAVLPGMLARSAGHIVNIGSTAGEFPYPGGNVYGATKAFVYHLGLNLRADLLGSPLRVCTIEPGMCSGTEFSNVRFHGDDAKAASVYADTTTPCLSADDVADAVAWVTSRPAHVNINSMQLMPVCQAFGPLAVKRVAK